MDRKPYLARVGIVGHEAALGRVALLAAVVGRGLLKGQPEGRSRFTHGRPELHSQLWVEVSRRRSFTAKTAYAVISHTSKVRKVLGKEHTY